MLNIALADLQLVFMPRQTNHQIQRPEKQMGATFQSWILHLQDPILTYIPAHQIMGRLQLLMNIFKTLIKPKVCTLHTLVEG